MVFPWELNSTRSARFLMRKSPRPMGRRTVAGRVGSVTVSGSKPGPSSVTWRRMVSMATSAATRTVRVGSPPAPNRMLLVSASASRTRSRKLVRRAGPVPATPCRAMSSTTSSTQLTSAGTRIATHTDAAVPSAGRPGRVPERRTQRRSGAALPSSISAARERLVRGGRDVEEGIELGQLEQGAEVVVEAGDPELTGLLANIPGETDQRPQAGGVGVSGLGEVDHELPLPPVESFLHQALELLAIPHNELAFHLEDGHAVVLGLAESHPDLLQVPAGAAISAASAMVPAISSKSASSTTPAITPGRSEERRVGEEGRAGGGRPRWS